MALDREDWLDLLRHLQFQLAERDPRAYELLSGSFEQSDNPRQALLSYIDTLIKLTAERSGGSHGWVLDYLNRYVRTEDGGPVRSLRVRLSEQEAELYGVPVVELAELPDRSEFIAELRDLRAEILEEREG